MHRLAATLCALGACMPLQAQERLPLWEAGVFVPAATQPAYPGARQRVTRVLPLPFLIYRGEVVRADRGSVGVRAAKTATVEVDTGLSGSFGSSADEGDAREGMPRIGTLGEIGPRIKLDLGDAPGGGHWRGELPLRLVYDIDHGFGFRGVTVEPEFGWERRDDEGWSWGASASLLFGSRRLGDTFYGVAPPYATATRPAYEARGGLIATRAGLTLSRRLAPDVRAFAMLRYDSVTGAANRASPLVERPGGVVAGIGVAWTWARSERSVDE